MHTPMQVSLFLQEGIQASSGRLVLPSPQSSLSGTVTYYDMRGGLELQERAKLKCLEVRMVHIPIRAVKKM